MVTRIFHGGFQTSETVTHPSGATPDDSWSKRDIKAYLDNHDIEHPRRATKEELLALIP